MARRIAGILLGIYDTPGDRGGKWVGSKPTDGLSKCLPLGSIDRLRVFLCVATDALVKT